MAKKAVIKRASKTWPYTTDKLAQAVELAHEGEGGYELEQRSSGAASLGIEDQRKARCDEAYEQYGPSVDLIKEQIKAWQDNGEDDDSEELYTVAETWAGIPQAAQIDLWLAPKKGGIFTTFERATIKSKLPSMAA
jgi:recombination protein RecT